MINGLLDQCHRFGWILNALLLGGALFFYAGQMDSRMRSLEERLTRLELIQMEMMRATRGKISNPRQFQREFDREFNLLRRDY